MRDPEHWRGVQTERFTAPVRVEEPSTRFGRWLRRRRDSRAVDAERGYWEATNDATWRLAMGVSIPLFFVQAHDRGLHSLRPGFAWLIVTGAILLTVETYARAYRRRSSGGEEFEPSLVERSIGSGIIIAGCAGVAFTASNSDLTAVALAAGAVAASVAVDLALVIRRSARRRRASATRTVGDP